DLYADGRFAKAELHRRVDALNIELGSCRTLKEQLEEQRVNLDSDFLLNRLTDAVTTLAEFEFLEKEERRAL
ncbi:MAG: hypothetical protein V3V62_06170, partial [bacterium]